MNEDRYERTIDELEPRACKWWPKEVRDEAQEISVLQTLLESQERFISILKLADKHNPSRARQRAGRGSHRPGDFLQAAGILSAAAGESDF